MKIDLNCDMGESFGAYTLGMDAEIISFISSANIACGFHAGDPLVMNRTVKLAADHGVGIGAHPGFPDLMGFGRRNMDCSANEIGDYLIYQIGALQAFCTAHGVRLRHVKPHGALYNMAVANEPLTRAIAQAISRIDRNLFMVALAGKHAGRMASIAREEGIKMIFEAFPDRAYTSEGTLVSRKQPGAVIHNPDEAAERALLMATEGVVIAVDGTRIPMSVDTLCVHGDNPSAVVLARTIRNRLEAAGVAVVPMAAHE
ncbi:MAG TPA: LamB/YcsF family protein [Deltaproteobacteria bacterium]|nr:LamB/YcsF family protein [Deltaproteobacteria bacterium]